MSFLSSELSNSAGGLFYCVFVRYFFKQQSTRLVRTHFCSGLNIQDK